MKASSYLDLSLREACSRSALPSETEPEGNRRQKEKEEEEERDGEDEVRVVAVVIWETVSNASQPSVVCLSPSDK